MPGIPVLRRIPLWLIFVGLMAAQLIPMSSARSIESYTNERGCTGEILTVGFPDMYTKTTSSCRGPQVRWDWIGIAVAITMALIVASLITTIVSESRRGASYGEYWLAALIVLLSASAVGSFMIGLGGTMTCTSREGVCGLGMMLGGGIGCAVALLGIALAHINKTHIGRLTRSAAYGAIPAMAAAFVAFCMLAAILQ